MGNIFVNHDGLILQNKLYHCEDCRDSCSTYYSAAFLYNYLPHVAISTTYFNGKKLLVDFVYQIGEVVDLGGGGGGGEFNGFLTTPP